MKVESTITSAMQPLVDLIYPPRCPLCGVSIANHGALCVDCFGDLELSLPFNRTDYTGSGQPRADVIAATVYNEASRQLILKFKHGGKIALADLIGKMMAARLSAELKLDEPLLVPVPLHRTRLWRRGYNQAALLARSIAQHLPSELDAEPCLDALIRIKRTQSLGGLGREARRSVLDGAIALRGSKANLVRNRSVVLVDDVYTSGATSDACVSALLEGGASAVHIACFARVQD